MGESLCDSSIDVEPASRNFETRPPAAIWGEFLRVPSGNFLLIRSTSYPRPREMLRRNRGADKAIGALSCTTILNA